MAGPHFPTAGRSAARACVLTVLAAGVFAVSAAPAMGASDPPGTKVGPGVYAVPSSELGGGDRSGDPSTGSDSGRQPRIVGGTPIDISQAPWQVAVTVSPEFFQGNAQQRQFCGGTLVTPTLVITAAHCVFNEQVTALEFSPQELSVVTGRTVLSSTQGEELPVADIIVFVDDFGFPLYNPNDNAWDVAALQLAQPSTTGTSIKLPGPDETELWSFGRRVFASGWGHTRFEGQGSDQLLMVEVMMVDNPRCIAIVGSGGFAGQTSVCAGALSGGRDSCQGDSGGPLVAPTAQGEVRLVGDVQSGVGCARKDHPGIYGRFGTPPVQTALDDVAVQFGGAAKGQIIGSGGTPPLDVTPSQGLELTRAYAQDVCSRKSRCRKFAANKCSQVGVGVQCRAQTTFKLRKSRKKKACNENILWTADTGVITGDRQGRKRCRKRG